ncbi:MAG: hypothetical protein R2806_10420 [Saprospiraceae bacterium]
MYKVTVDAVGDELGGHFLFATISTMSSIPMTGISLQFLVPSSLPCPKNVIALQIG